MLIAPKWLKLQTSNLAGMSGLSLGTCLPNVKSDSNKNALKLLFCKYLPDGNMQFMHSSTFEFIILSMHVLISEVENLESQLAMSKVKIRLPQVTVISQLEYCNSVASSYCWQAYGIFEENDQSTLQGYFLL